MVNVLSLGRLVHNSGYTFEWKPEGLATLRKGKDRPIKIPAKFYVPSINPVTPCDDSCSDTGSGLTEADSLDQCPLSDDEDDPAEHQALQLAGPTHLRAAPTPTTTVEDKLPVRPSQDSESSASPPPDPTPESDTKPNQETAEFAKKPIRKASGRSADL